jgi:hypothetical protein
MLTGLLVVEQRYLAVREALEARPLPTPRQVSQSAPGDPVANASLPGWWRHDRT